MNDVRIITIIVYYA